ncbi:hypothetical protein ACFFQF_03565 [Haladaptatus pallidirubidus]|nr:hypothetical protein [Haladaptatus pallidirubidus]
MRDEWSVRTERATFLMRDGELRVRTTPSSVFKGLYRQKWRQASVIGRGLFLFSLVGTGWGIERLVGTTLGDGPDEWLPFVLLWAGFAFMAFGFLMNIYTRNVRIPIRSILDVERNADGRALHVTYTESEAVEETEIKFSSETSAEKAVAELRYKGIRVSESNHEATAQTTDSETEEAVER